jgi:hypothetical protein
MGHIEDPNSFQSFPHEVPLFRVCWLAAGILSSTERFENPLIWHILIGPMKPARAIVLAVFLATALSAQSSERNPVDELKDQVTQVLRNAGVPFSAEQDKQLALLIEDQRQASENLFGEIWDFRNGPPEGEQRDRALAGIQWMTEEFKKKLPAYMTDAQRAAWENYQSSGTVSEVEVQGDQAQTGKIQQIRVTNNAFNVETATTSGNNGPTGGGARTEVIERGGAGAFHGNFVSTFQDEALNARNPFAINKPPYYERTIDGNISGPVIRDRLTMNLTVSDNKAENVGTVKAELPEGPFALGVTRPVIKRSYNLKGILQLTNAHSLNMGFQYASSDSKNENVGDFALPERASRTQAHNYSIDLREISILSERTVHDVRFKLTRDHSERNPGSTAVAIIVKDAFTGGGAQNRTRNDTDTYELSNLIYFAGETLTMRVGVQAWHRRLTSFSEDNFFGEFTFSDLASYRAGRPLKYRITCCDPLFRMSQTQLGLFSQNDLKLTRTFTLMLGARYQIQTNIHDRNNFDPRIGFAYAIGNSTVVRGGSGIFSDYLADSEVLAYTRVDGKRLYEIQIDNPGWPDPFAAGSIRPRSRRQLEPNMKVAYYWSSQITLERSLPRNLFVTLSYDFNRGIKPTRTRDINAPQPGTVIRPNPNEGQVLQDQSSGLSSHRHLKATMRQRFSIFNITANYTWYEGQSDGPVGGNLALPTNSYDLNQDWGKAGGGPHAFSMSVNSKMPLEVYLTTAINFKSGNYYTITTGKDDNQDGVINDRPAGVPKNSAQGPHYFDVSFNFSKAFPLGAAAGAQPQRGATSIAAGAQVNVFANLNNAFNMTHPGTPSGVMTSPFFRRSFSASSPREIEVGMRFQF